MYHVREFLSELPVHMDLNNFFARLQKEDEMRASSANYGTEVANPGMSLTVRAKSLIGNFVANADEEILRKVDNVARKICNKVSPQDRALEVLLQRSQGSQGDQLRVNALHFILIA